MNSMKSFTPCQEWDFYRARMADELYMYYLSKQYDARGVLTKTKDTHSILIRADSHTYRVQIAAAAAAAAAVEVAAAMVPAESCSCSDLYLSTEK